MYGVLESCSCTYIVIVMSAKKEEGKNKADYWYVYRRYSDVVFCTYNVHVADTIKNHRPYQTCGILVSWEACKCFLPNLYSVIFIIFSVYFSSCLHVKSAVFNLQYFSISIEWNVQTNITNWICMNLWKIIVTSYLFVKKKFSKKFLAHF